MATGFPICSPSMPISLLQAGMISPSWIWIDSLGTVTRASKKVSLINSGFVLLMEYLRRSVCRQYRSSLRTSTHLSLSVCRSVLGPASSARIAAYIPSQRPTKDPCLLLGKFITISAGFQLGAAPQRTFQTARKQIGLLKPPWTVLQIKGTQQDFGSMLLV